MKLHKIVLLFYVLYAILVCAGYGFIEYPPISFYTIVVIFIYVSSFVVGAYAGDRLNGPRIDLGFRINASNLLVFLTLLSAVLIAMLWSINISHYGSLEYILLNSFTIRSNSIGLAESIFPIYLTYPSSLVYPAFVIAVVLFEEGGQRKYLAIAAVLFVLIVLQDLLTFGRIGILYAIFSFVGYCVVYRKRILKLKNLVMFSLLFFILMLPRLVRGSFDNMSGTMDNYLPYIRFHIHPALYTFVSVYIYYFSSPFALDQYLSWGVGDLTLGQRTFTPIYNILSKFLGFDRINTIDPMANIPFDYNIYTFIKDLYSDFSLFGVAVVPLFVGLMFGKLYRGNTALDNCTKIYLLAWLFYTPLFNAYSFGGFFIGFAFLLILSLMSGGNESICNNSQL